MTTQTLTIDGIEYPVADLTDEARSQLANVQIADQEIARPNMLLALAQTARNAYATALGEALPKTEQ